MSCNGFATFNNTTGEVSLQDLNLHGGEITAMKMAYNVLYLSGTFTQINSVNRQHLAAIDLTTGSLLPWAPLINGPVYAFEHRGTQLFVGGDFTTVNSTARNGLAAVHVTTGATLPFTANLDNGAVKTLHIFENSLFAGGTFTSIEGALRSRVASVDVADGSVLPWNTLDLEMEEVTRVVANASVVAFQDIAYSVVGLNANDGEIMFNFPEDIKSILYVDNNMLVGGPFEVLNGSAFNGLAQVSLTTAEPTSWVPDVLQDASNDPSVYALARTVDRLYVGGGFRAMGFENRTGFGAYAIETAGCTEPDPISATDEILTAPAGDRYQWFAGGVLLDDENAQTLEIDVEESGLYTVVVSNDGCPNTYLDYEHTPPVVTGLESSRYSVLYPNPVKDKLHIQLSPAEEVYSIVVRNLQGKTMDVAWENNQIFVSSLPRGYYILTLISSQRNRSFKVIKVD